MKEKIKISVIIPTFNSEKTVKKTLESLCMQDLEGVEIIIIDGQSRDKTLEISEGMKENLQNRKGQVQIVSEKDSGIYDGMNKGIKLSRGEWIYFLGSDDYLEENILEKIKIILEKEEKDYDVLVFGVNLIKNGKKLKEMFPKKINGKKSFYFSNRVNHQGVIAKRITLDEGFDLKYRLVADREWFMRSVLNKKFRVKSMDIILCNYNLTGASSNYEKVREEYHRVNSIYLNRNIVSCQYYLKMILRKIRDAILTNKNFCLFGGNCEGRENDNA